MGILRPTGPSTWASRFVHADGIGSIRRLTNETGTITDGYTYTAFGELLAHTGTDPQPYAFAGEPSTRTAGFQYHRARWMDPRTATFTSADPFPGAPADPQSLHRYLYAEANPLNKVDPTGLFSASEASVTASVVMNLATQQAVFGLELIGDLIFKDNSTYQAVKTGVAIIGITGAVVSLSRVALRLARSNWFSWFLARLGLRSDKVLTFRGDRASLLPETVFETGFLSKGTHEDLFEHVSGVPGDFVSTSQSKDIALEFAGSNGYVYEIRSGRGLDSRRLLQDGHPFPEQLEITIPGGIDPSEVVGAHVVRGGKLTGEFIPNPNHKE